MVAVERVTVCKIHSKINALQNIDYGKPQVTSC